jgi:molybdopterin converting factor small subunit
MVGGSQIVVEFFGMARARAGRAELSVPAATPRAALMELRSACPGLGDLWRKEGGLAPHYLLSLDGERFLTDLDEPLPPGTVLLLLSADAGG